MFLIIFLVVLGIIIIGVLLGGESFGDTLRKGCGCVITIIIICVILFLIFFADQL